MTCGAIYGANQQVFVTKESVYKDRLAVTGTDAVSVISSTISPTQEWIEDLSHQGSASLISEIEGKRGGTWELVVHVRPNGTAGQLPQELDNLFDACMLGTVTSGGSNVIYTLSSSADPISLQIVRYAGDSWCEWVNGACVETVTFSQESGQPGTITFAGSFAEIGYLKGAPVVDGTGYATGTSITLAAASAYLIRVGAQIKTANDTNGGAGYEVTAVSSDGLTLTITPTMAGSGFLAGVSITPVVPTASYSGDPVVGIDCGLSIDGTATDFISASVTYSTGFHLLDQEASTASATCVAPGARRIEMEASFVSKDTTAGLDGNGWVGNTRAIILRMGRDTATERLKITIPACRLSPADPDFPTADEATFTVSGKARQSAAADDEMTITLD